MKYILTYGNYSGLYLRHTVTAAKVKFMIIIEKQATIGIVHMLTNKIHLIFKTFAEILWGEGN